MASKEYGNTRAITPTTVAVKASRREYEKYLKSDIFNKELSFFVEDGGGYLLYAKDRKMDNYEYNAATLMAHKGYPMRMTPEGGNDYYLTIINGSKKYGDGRIAFTSYEQRSPKAANDATARKTVENAINHARKKGAQIAVIYDYSRSFKPADIKHGCEHYVRNNEKRRYKSVEWVIVVSGSGNVHEWNLNKK